MVVWGSRWFLVPPCTNHRTSQTIPPKWPGQVPSRCAHDVRYCPRSVSQSSPRKDPVPWRLTSIISGPKTAGWKNKVVPGSSFKWGYNYYRKGFFIQFTHLFSDPFLIGSGPKLNEKRQKRKGYSKAIFTWQRTPTSLEFDEWIPKITRNDPNFNASFFGVC